MKQRKNDAFQNKVKNDEYRQKNCKNAQENVKFGNSISTSFSISNNNDFDMVVLDTMDEAIEIERIELELQLNNIFKL